MSSIPANLKRIAALALASVTIAKSTTTATALTSNSLEIISNSDNNITNGNSVFTIKGSLSVNPHLQRLSRESNIFKDCKVTLENPTLAAMDSENSSSHRSVFVTNKGEFQIPNVPNPNDNLNHDHNRFILGPQFYHLEVFHPMFSFESYTIEVPGDGNVRATISDVLYGSSSGGSGNFNGNSKEYFGELVEYNNIDSDIKTDELSINVTNSDAVTNTNSMSKVFYLPQIRGTNLKFIFEEREAFDVMSLFKNPMLIFMVIMMGIMWCMPKQETLQEMKREQLKAKKQ